MGGKPVPGFALSLNYLAFTVGTFSGWYHLTSPNSCRGGKATDELQLQLSDQQAHSCVDSKRTKAKHLESDLTQNRSNSTCTFFSLLFALFAIPSFPFIFFRPHTQCQAHARGRKKEHTHKKKRHACVVQPPPDNRLNLTPPLCSRSFPHSRFTNVFFSSFFLRQKNGE